MAKEKKFYAVKVGRKIGVYKDWKTCKKQVHKYPNAKYKSFLSLESAYKYIGKNVPKNSINETKKESKKTKICVLCEIPHTRKAHCCHACGRKLKEIKNIVEPFSKYKSVSIAKVLNIKVKYNVSDVFEFIKNNPIVWKTLDSHEKRLEIKRNLRSYHRSDDYKNHNYEKWEGDIPSYILEVFKKYPLKQLLTISGDMLNPNIHYYCNACKKEQMQFIDDIKSNKSHGCDATISSGELLVKKYLENKVDFKVQRDTLMCINPLTQRQLPYDFEIPSKKIIIEVQGAQHVKFIEYFHGTKENFNYQRRKDDFKKRFAEKKGYKVIYIFYDEIKSGEYKNILDSALDI